MTREVWRDRTKASGGQVHADPPDCGNYQSRLDDLFATIEKRVANKLGKPYAAGTIIAVPERCVPQLQTYLRDTLSKQTLGTFCGVFIIRASGKTFLEFGETLGPRAALTGVMA